MEDEQEQVRTHEHADFIEAEPLPVLDIRQRICWENYTSPKSETFGNAYRSALKTGYSESYSRVITNQGWFIERLRRLNMLGRAEKVLKKTLVMKTTDAQGNEQADLLRIQVDTAKHITKTLGKDEGYSERSEVTGKDGQPIVFMPAELVEKYGLIEEKK